MNKRQFHTMLTAAALGLALAGASVMAGAQAVDTKSMNKAAQTKKVDISADGMEIFDQKNQAVFTGNVKAVRRDTTLTADKLVVDYRKVKKKDGSQDTEVTFLNANGHVRIVTPEQTITGNHAKMDVKKNLLWVTGNVVVKKKTSTIRGAKLFANLDTNVSRIEAGKKGRVHGIFTPAK